MVSAQTLQQAPKVELEDKDMVGKCLMLTWTLRLTEGYHNLLWVSLYSQWALGLSRNLGRALFMGQLIRDMMNPYVTSSEYTKR